jgi:hypothetical protein
MIRRRRGAADREQSPFRTSVAVAKPFDRLDSATRRSLSACAIDAVHHERTIEAPISQRSAGFVVGFSTRQHSPAWWRRSALPAATTERNLNVTAFQSSFGAISSSKSDGCRGILTSTVILPSARGPAGATLGLGFHLPTHLAPSLASSTLMSKQALVSSANAVTQPGRFA